ncbi:PIN domain-containing protein [Verticiella sediminum]|uniref:PIN domain-containing protein n=1 Tax=Verticiella sediminum TaxID=1247510 RepID=A0A556AXM3_9BURK|nr:PIN domain-containing protein [Verticiella sediminum]TSH97689.1 PIN domain-containing protein [Verticiella sediminum]
MSAPERKAVLRDAGALQRAFIDSNILVHTDATDAPAKRDCALALIEQHMYTRTGVISTQVLQEYYAVATRKLGVVPELAQRKAALFARLDVVQVDLQLILAAIDLLRLHRLSFWDALIVQAGRVGGCPVLLSEDLHDGGRLRDIRVVNPFST